jgi:hypothetical protein
MGSVGSNAIHKEADGWYFWDETWAHRLGPFTSEKKCEIKLTKYAHWLSTGEYEGNWND